uniref:DNA-directed RNA polymerase I subunit RPA1 n=1 Tax=Trypanosoma vivax (strain Y486) TaxID=1055687 RepID=G0U1A2_TRYVY|nr:putative DNA-directed rna polymerase I largest subunit [Trypanosoma vivax Y486]
MSLITDFPFHAYMGDLKTRRVVECKNSVSLSLLTPDDMSDLAFVEVRTRVGQEERTAPWRPVIRNGEKYATFYDTRMGNFDLRSFPPQSCQTCAGNLTGKYGNERCQGHFGYISMPRRFPGNADMSQERLVVVNPHMAEEVDHLLRAKCFFCHRFRCPCFDVERYRQALLLVDHGHIGEALHLLDVVSTTKGYDTRHKRLYTANEEVINDMSMLEQHVERILKKCQGGAPSGRETNDDSSPGGAGKRKTAIDVRNTIAQQALRDFREFPAACSHCRAVSPKFSKRNGHIFFSFKKSALTTNISHAFLSQAQVNEWETNNQLHRRNLTYLSCQNIFEHIKCLFRNEGTMLEMLFPHLGEPSVFTKYRKPMAPEERYKVFFIERILVPPLPLRLSSGVKVNDCGSILPDEHTRTLSDILGFVEQIECYQTLCNNSKPGRCLVNDAQRVANEMNLRNLQLKVNEYYTTILDSFAKKEGLFRMNMMGKRVNQACRSVISPDPLVEPNEVLLPRPFARALSFPEQVTCYAPVRMNLLKHCVINGPRRYPGATHIELRHSNGEIRFVDLDVPEQTRRQHAAKYFAMAQSGVTMIVYRHILNGDRVVFNRQPTLHKPSMMGYRVRVLSGFKTIRFHYVNGSSFNADFDGDEMNIHVPQSLEAKAEISSLMDANSNYLVPTSGKPIRGLIQDHIVAGVMLTLRDKFFDRATFVQLVYYGLGTYLQQQGQVTLSELIPVPAILMPRPLWTGKQVISVVTRFVSYSGGEGDFNVQNESGVSIRGTSLIQPSAFDTTPAGSDQVRSMPRTAIDDNMVLFMNSELLIGLLCKKQLGASSMSIAHVIHELYGPHKVGQLFGALGRILMLSLQSEGFSFGMDDMCLVQEKRRCELLRQLDEAPLSLPDDEATAMTKIMEHSTKLQQEFMPGRMKIPFPRNHLLMMTTSGAKGSSANATQMSLGLGQQLFDGLRVKRMNSGKTLPAFFINEKRARSFGYAIGSFASGIRPSEYVIHAMAGRDGLIDTAVKTSRSGHLQRCLIKGLESLVVHMDHSVRDSNGSVIQFMYGGDGLDPCKASTLTAWEMAKDNATDLAKRFGVEGATTSRGDEGEERPKRVKRSREDEEAPVSPLPKHMQRMHMEQHLNSNALPSTLSRSLETYLVDKATYPLFRKVSQVERWMNKRRVVEKLAERRKMFVEYYNDIITSITTRKRAWAFCEAGEPVGLLAAQAAGEPSTQMTLNTFHSAGSTVKHVTEGIPRLRELLIYASVRNAAVVVPVKNAVEEDEAAIARILRAGVAIKLSDCLASAGNNSAFSGSEDVKCGRKGLNSAGGKGYHYRVARRGNDTVLTLALLFSRTYLEDSLQRMCMTHDEHLDSFTESLKEFSRRIVRALRGITHARAGTSDGEFGDKGVDAGGLGDVLGSGGFGGDGCYSVAGDKSDMDESFCGSDAEGKSSMSSAQDGGSSEGSLGRADASRRVDRSDGEGSEGSPINRGDQNDEDNRSSDNDDNDEDDEHEHKIKKQAQDNEEEEGEEELRDGGTTSDSSRGQWNKTSSAVKVTYSNFPPLRIKFTDSSKFSVDLAPLDPAAAARDGVTTLPDDLFIINIVVRMPSSIIAVIPDVVDSSLKQQTLPSWLPQFGSVTFTRQVDDPSSGELVFQGANATMRNVLSYVSLFTVRSKAIKVREACSTDIREMANTLGVESAYNALYDELSKLFRRYSVDSRHLSLIADTATHRGKWENFNFTGVISQSASPLFQMTFASSKRWLHLAVSRGLSDELQSISSAIIVGERPRVGTACAKLALDSSVLRDVLERNFA